MILDIDMLSTPFKIKSPLCDSAECHTVKSPDISPPFMRWHVAVATTDTDTSIFTRLDGLWMRLWPFEVRGKTSYWYILQLVGWTIVYFVLTVSDRQPDVLMLFLHMTINPWMIKKIAMTALELCWVNDRNDVEYNEMWCASMTLWVWLTINTELIWRTELVFKQAT